MPVDYEGIEFVDITPLDTVTGRTGDDGAGTPDGQLVVFPPDYLESNPTRLTATPLGTKPVFFGGLSIDPGPTELPPPFGSIGGDEDWFELRPSKTSTFRFDVLFEEIPTLPSGRQGLPGDGDLRIEVYSPTGTLIDSSDTTDNDESLAIGMAAGMSYYLRVLGVENAVNVYDLNVEEVDVLGPQVFDPDGGGPLGGVHITDDPGTVRNEAEFDLFAGKDPTDGSTPTPPVNSLTINLRDPLDATLDVRQPGFVYPALDAVAAMQPGNYRLVGDQVGIIPIARVLVTNNPVIAGEVATATVELIFFGPLPDDRYTLTVLDSVVDPVGNKLDGESNAAEPQSPPDLPSGNGYSGGNFTARFTVDSRPEIGVYIGKTVVVDINGNGTYDPANADAANRDLVFDFGQINDQRLAGKLSPTLLPGFDVLIAYGQVNASGPYRWLIDTNGNGRVDAGEEFPAPQIDGIAVAGDFNPALPGDELAIFDGTTWHLLLAGVGGAVTTVSTSLRGYPIAGDFNGDGTEDLGTYQNDTFYLSYGPFGGGVASLSQTIAFGAPGKLDRPVAADMDLDGIDDLGIWVPDAGAGQGTGEWRFLMSSDPAGLNHAFSPTPLGHDIAFRFGDPRALPIVGNFDPPVAAASSTESTAAAKVAALYEQVLDREPDAAGGSYWTDMLLEGMGDDTVMAGLLTSPEYAAAHPTNQSFVAALYEDVLGRPAEPAGLAAHVSMLESGASHWQVVSNLLRSPERAQKIGRPANLAAEGSLSAAGSATSSAEAVVNALYHDILGRAPDAGGKALFVGKLNAGASAQSVARALLSSPEYNGLLVDGMYQKYLGRAADAMGRAFWIGRLAAGATPDAVAAGLLGSTEYALQHAGNQALVTALYHDILGRAPDAAGLAHHLAALDAGHSRSEVIENLLASDERLNLLLAQAYQTMLKRKTDAEGARYFATLDRSARRDERILLAALAGSAEYRNLATD